MGGALAALADDGIIGFCARFCSGCSFTYALKNVSGFVVAAGVWAMVRVGIVS